MTSEDFYAAWNSMHTHMSELKEDDPSDDWTPNLDKLKFLPRDPENMDPYGPQNHPLKETSDD